MFAPTANGTQVHAMTSGDGNSDFQRLTVVPMIEGNKAVTTGVCRGQCRDNSPLDLELDRLDVHVATDRKRARRKFHEERSFGMLVLIAHAPEADTGHRVVQLCPGDGILDDEVQVGRLVSSSSIKTRTGAAGQDSADTRRPESRCDAARDIGHTGPLAQPHSGLPVRLGLRRRSPIRFFSSSSGSVRRKRKRRRSSYAK